MRFVLVHSHLARRAHTDRIGASKARTCAEPDSPTSRKKETFVSLTDHTYFVPLVFISLVLPFHHKSASDGLSMNAHLSQFL